MAASSPHLDDPAAALSGDLRWTPLRPDLVPAWHRLVEVCTAADDGDEHLTQEDLADELAPQWLDLDADTVIGCGADGTARAFGLVLERPGVTSERKVTCWGGVDPQWRGRGIGQGLIAWQIGRARAHRRPEDARPGGRALVAYAHAKEPLSSATRLLTRTGFERVRFHHVMRRPLPAAGGSLQQVAVPDGVRLTDYTPDLADALREVHNQAFADHWGFVPWTPQEWRLWTVEHRWFRPDWSIVALAGDRVVGYTLSSGYEPDWAVEGVTEGWTGKLGVHADQRGRGIAGALLCESMRRFAADGIQYAGLDVDAENTSGAVALYTGLGYEARSTTATWRFPLDAADGSGAG